MKKIEQPLPKLIVVVGQTASGKSALAVLLARRFDGEIISADSRQVYRGLNIGTGKITKREMRGVPHHLLDVADPRISYSAGQYKKDAEKILRYIVIKGKLPIIVGGTGFYIDALLGTVSLPEVQRDTALRRRLSKKSAAELFIMLKKLDAKRARDIDRNNPVRLIRAIEIAKMLGATPKIKPQSHYEVLKIGLKISDAKLEKNIHTRLTARMRAGMIAEVKRLHANGLSWKRMEALGLEYRYLARYLQGKNTREELLRCIATESVRYAKRQMRWFKRDLSIIWIDSAHKAEAERKVKEFLT